MPSFSDPNLSRSVSSASSCSVSLERNGTISFQNGTPLPRRKLCRKPRRKPTTVTLNFAKQPSLQFAETLGLWPNCVVRRQANDKNDFLQHSNDIIQSHEKSSKVMKSHFRSEYRSQGPRTLAELVGNLGWHQTAPNRTKYYFLKSVRKSAVRCRAQHACRKRYTYMRTLPFRKNSNPWVGGSPRNFYPIFFRVERNGTVSFQNGTPPRFTKTCRKLSKSPSLRISSSHPKVPQSFCLSLPGSVSARKALLKIKSHKPPQSCHKVTLTSPRHFPCFPAVLMIQTAVSNDSGSLG
jgi:hypothetical protein